MMFLIKAGLSAVVLIISSIALSEVVAMTGNLVTLKIQESPKALINLQDIYLPPLVNLQSFVIVFDALVFLYYLYQCPFWERLKKQFAYYQYEFHPVEQQDCSNLFLKTLFILFTKVIPLNVMMAGSRSWNSDRPDPAGQV